MHPLPRVNEIAADVDKDSRAKYFEQVNYGKFARMSLLLTLLKDGGASGETNSAACLRKRAAPIQDA